MPRSTVRVNVPSNPTEQIALLKQVEAKNTALGAGSPLAGLKWAEISPALADAKTHDDEARDLAKKLETEYGARDVSMPVVTNALRSSRDILLALNRDNPKALGDFGFVVDDTPQAKPAPTPPPAP